jgi:DNA-directed RNA polymerase
MLSIRDYQAVRAEATANDMAAIPEPASYARTHVEKLAEQGYTSLVLRQLAREAQSSRRTHDLDSLEKHAKAFKLVALENGLATFVEALETGREAYGRREPIRHFGQGRNPVNALSIETQAVLTWDAVCSVLGRMVIEDRPLSVQTLAKMLGRRLKTACGGAEEYRTLGYERAALTLLDFFCTATGWVEELQGVYSALRKRNETNSYRLTRKFLADVLGGSLACDFSERRPMLVPPVPWSEAAKHGGYLSNGIQAIRDVRAPIHAPEVVAALNALQATPFRINQRVLETARAFRVNAEDLGGAVVQGYYVEARHDIDADVYRSKTIRSALTLAAASELENEEAFYFPWNLDWRGRMYPATTIISPQGSDLCKGLLEFADGAPLGRDGIRWLDIHLCNLFGADKVMVDGKKVHRTPDERAAWTQGRYSEFLWYASEPLTHRGWMKADKPWQFLAACFELEGSIAEGEAFRSRIAGALDGSCSGVQMLAGMTRDVGAGAMVNLVPAERGDDYYGRMAEALTRRLVSLVPDADENTSTMLRYWSDFEINRDLLKAPSMTKVYSAGTFTFAEQIQNKADAAPNASLWLAAQINQCFADVAPGMLRAMEYVQGVSDVLTDAGYALDWVTPAGLSVTQARMCMETQIIQRGSSGHSPRRLNFEIETDRLNKRAQRAGVSPNFVHGVDASHMVYVINALHARGVRNFWMIHDSFGAPLAQCSDVFDATREQFARLMSRDLLAEWTEQVTAVLTPEQRESLPDLPEYGALDLDQVKESIYAWF